MSEQTPETCSCRFDDQVTGLIYLCPLHAKAPAMRAFIEKVANTHSTHWLAKEAVDLLREIDE